MVEPARTLIIFLIGVCIGSFVQLIILDIRNILREDKKKCGCNLEENKK